MRARQSKRRLLNGSRARVANRTLPGKQKDSFQGKLILWIVDHPEGRQQQNQHYQVLNRLVVES